MRPDRPSSSPPPLPDISSLLIDRNQDGFPDDILGLLVVPEPLDRETWEAVLNLVARLALSSSGFTPPLIANEPLIDRVSITVRPGDAERLASLAMTSPEPESEFSGANPTTVDRKTVDMADPWSIDGLLLDRDDDQIADDSAFHIELPDELPDEVGSALAELVARLGIECASIQLPLAGGTKPSWRLPLRLDINRDDCARFESTNDGSLRFAGSESAVPDGIRRLARQSSGFLPDVPGHRAREWLRRSIAGWTAEGRAAHLRTTLGGLKPDRIVLLDQDPRIRQRLAGTARDVHPDIPVEPPSRRESVVFDHQWTAEWEVDRLLASLESDILPALDPWEPVQLLVMISEPPGIRRRVRGQISRKMLERGFHQGQVHVLDAFKPGLTWLREVVLLELRKLDRVRSITIQFRWWDPDPHPGQLDLPIRWLQELFPIDEIFARELGIDLENIQLEAAQASESIYRVIAIDDSGDILLERSFSPLWRRIDYLAGIPEAGNVTVTTGGIIATQADQSHRTRVLTDPEVFWRYVQGELLPNLRRFVLAETGGHPSVRDQPFFEELFIDLRLSASDEPYGIRQERHSAAEALHEDIYFNVLDYLEELGTRTSGEKLSAPGSIRPFVNVVPGRQPEARARLTRRPAGIARIISDGRAETVPSPENRLLAAPRVTAIDFRAQQLVYETGPAENQTFPDDLLQALATESDVATAQAILRVPRNGGGIEIGIPELADPGWPEDVATEPVPADTIISNREIVHHLNRLAKHPQVTLVSDAEVSWQGRPIPAVAVTSPQQAVVWSMRKLACFKPTKLIVARHHANEVASTTSALKLIEALVTDPTGEAMLRGLNVVFLPLENPDGAAFHDLLRRDNPTWKHHPARYNATGYEFGEDQGNSDSPYGEGRVRDRVWRACLPDIVVDNHGVPSHEWAQLFAGFGSPPRFNVSYWQVQALLYGILPWYEDPVHERTMEAVRERVAAAVADDADLLRWNRTYTERYRTWGHEWVPERFPLQLFGEMLFHVNPVDPDSVRGRRSCAVRYPRTTVLNWITEVCDETVQGDELERTARAHLTANKAVLELLREHHAPMHTRSEPESHGVRIIVGRERPLRLNF